MKFRKAMSMMVALTVVGAMALTGCAAGGSSNDTYPKGALEFVAPSGAGGGWDLTIRTVAKVLQDTDLVSVPMPVTNKSGSGGGVNLAYMQTQKRLSKINNSLLTTYSFN